MNNYRIDLLTVLVLGFLLTSMLSLVFVAGSTPTSTATTTWDTPPKQFNGGEIIETEVYNNAVSSPINF